MSFITDIVGDITGTNKAADAASQASEVQAGLSREGIAEQRRQFDLMVQRTNPFLEPARPAPMAMSNLLGLQGDLAQQGEISALENSPYFQAMQRQGENAILQNAAATGGLRGGNAQAALMQFSPMLLNQLVQQRLQNLSGFGAAGQSAAAMQGATGMQTGANVANLLAQQGQAQAGGIMAQGGANRQAFGDIMQIAGTVAGMGGFKMPSFGRNVGYGVP